MSQGWNFARSLFLWCCEWIEWESDMNGTAEKSFLIQQEALFSLLNKSLPMKALTYRPWGRYCASAKNNLDSMGPIGIVLEEIAMLILASISGQKQNKNKNKSRQKCCGTLKTNCYIWIWVFMDKSTSSRDSKTQHNLTFFSCLIMRKWTSPQQLT